MREKHLRILQRGTEYIVQRRWLRFFWVDCLQPYKSIRGGDIKAAFATQKSAEEYIQENYIECKTILETYYFVININL